MEQPSGGAPKNILVVEDELPLLKAIKSKLELNGFEVVTARSVQQALNVIEEIGVFDAVWTDHYLLGNETGLDLVAHLKTSEKWKDVPIFVVSVTASPHNIDSYLTLGVEKFYTKHEYRIDDIVKELKSKLSINNKN